MKEGKVIGDGTGEEGKNQNMEGFVSHVQEFELFPMGRGGAGSQ